MTRKKALQIVLELAEANQLSLKEAESAELMREHLRQVDAVTIVKRDILPTT